MASGKKRRLGKGLDALLSPKPSAQQAAPKKTEHAAEADTNDRVLRINPRELSPNPKQPRSTFREEALEELAESVRRDGIQEPVIVRRKGDKYELVSGERRVRASIMADLETVPAICREVSDSDMLKLGLIENIQREDLNAIELAKGYQQLIEEFGWTQEELSEQVGKKRATVTNTIRLLNLPKTVQDSLANEEITMGHARALLGIENTQAQIAACRKVIRQGLSVRQTEKLAQPAQAKKKPTEKDPHLAQLEDDLRRRLGTRVTVKSDGKSKGSIQIEYYNLDDLERILDLLQSSR